MTEPTDCLCGGGKDGTPRMDIVCPVHDADPTLLDSEIRQKLEMLEVPKMIFWVDKEMKVEKTKLTDKTIDEILALIATETAKARLDELGSVQLDYGKQQAHVWVNGKLVHIDTRLSELQEMLNG